MVGTAKNEGPAGEIRVSRRPTYAEIARLARRLQTLVERLRRGHKRAYYKKYRNRPDQKAARLVYQAAYQKAHPDMLAAAVRAWRKRHPRRMRALYKRYYRRHRKAILAKRYAAYHKAKTSQENAQVTSNPGG